MMDKEKEFLKGSNDFKYFSFQRYISLCPIVQACVAIFALYWARNLNKPEMLYAMTVNVGQFNVIMRLLTYLVLYADNVQATKCLYDTK